MLYCGGVKEFIVNYLVREKREEREGRKALYYVQGAYSDIRPGDEKFVILLSQHRPVLNTRLERLLIRLILLLVITALTIIYYIPLNNDDIIILVRLLVPEAPSQIRKPSILAASLVYLLPALCLEPTL